MINFIKKIFNRSNIKEGDIIFAKRYKNNKEKVQIEEGHQNGPFIILKKKFNKYICLYCTGSNYKNNPFYIEMFDNYNLLKKTFINISQEYKLSSKHFISFIDKLSKEDFNKLKKIIFLKGKINNVKINYNVGDIIEYRKQLYYIFNVNNNELECYYIFKKKKSKNPIIINNVAYSFDLFSNKRIKINRKIKLIDIATKQEINNVNKKRLICEQSRKDTHIIARGDLVKYNNDYYYIYGENGNNYNTYKIYLSNLKTKKLIKLYIHNGYYFSELEEMDINKNNNIIYVKSAYEEEIDNIKKLKKQNKIVSKEQIYCKKIQKKCIVEDYNLNKYLIIKRVKNIIDCMNLDSFKVEQYNLQQTHFNYLEKISNLEYQNYLLKLNKKILEKK